MSAERLPDRFRIDTDQPVNILLAGEWTYVTARGVLTDIENGRAGFWMRLHAVRGPWAGDFVEADGRPLIYVPAGLYENARTA